MDTDDDELELGDLAPHPGFRWTIVRNALNRSLTDEILSTAMSRQIVILLNVPNDAWSSAIAEALANRLAALAMNTPAGPRGARATKIHFFRRKPPRRKPAFEDSDGDLIVAIQKIRDGFSVIGIVSPASERMRLLTEQPDLVVSIKRPTREDIQDAYRQVTGAELKIGPDARLDGADLVGIEWSIRPRDTPEAIAARLSAKPAQPSDDGIPMIEDLHGYGAAKDWALSAKRTLQRIRAGDPETSWNDLPRGLLIVGPAGVGKTIFARSLAKTLEIQAVMTSASQWLSAGDGNLGSVVRAMREVIDEACASQPGLLFVDECDSISERDDERGTSISWWLNFVNAFLSAIDGAVRTPGLLIVGAANNADRIDKAVKRAGRLETLVQIGLPDVETRRGIFGYYLKGAIGQAGISAAALRSEGRTGADIAKVVRDAKALAADAGIHLAVEHVLQAISPRRARPAGFDELVARHEAGHAVAAVLLGRKVVAVDLDQGQTYLEPMQPVFTDAAAVGAMICMLAGRAADEVLNGAPSSGAGGGPTSDIALATTLAAARRRSFGLQGLIYAGSPSELSRVINADASFRVEIEADLTDIYRKARELIVENKASVLRLAEELQSRRFMTGSEVEICIRETHRQPALDQ